MLRLPASEKCAKEGVLLQRRQALYMVYLWFKMNQEVGALFNIADLMAVKINKSFDLSSFLTAWETILSGMDREPDIDSMHYLFLQNVEKVPTWPTITVCPSDTTTSLTNG